MSEQTVKCPICDTALIFEEERRISLSDIPSEVVVEVDNKKYKLTVCSYCSKTIKGMVERYENGR